MPSTLQAGLANALIVLDSQACQLSPLKAQRPFKIPGWESHRTGIRNSMQLQYAFFLFYFNKKLFVLYNLNLLEPNT